MFIKLKDNKMVSGLSDTTTVYYFILMTTCFGHVTIIGPSVQNLEYGTCRANNAHIIWDPVRLTNVLKYIKKWV